ncbi:hypothetical protein FAES_4557 [Fibrella aestuarina BUZ 2]|uniref:DUF4286 domain-containing protein n=1 Tax=Fibrella aestuarina BUZ 2 TaxID=1166018 RepID=I0KEK3_9BACT|nr:DUF4286 family protein [Fibrella aestuarina]CCH02556.1 hypothetical protein FAES_4557 [Fibrella aestuarina BUZ 2]
MILYNITMNVDLRIEREFLRWMKDVHVPDVMNTGLPINNNVLKLLTEIDNGGATYTFQYWFQTMEDFLTYQSRYQSALQQQVADRYTNRYTSFRTLLEEV